MRPCARRSRRSLPSLSTRHLVNADADEAADASGRRGYDGRMIDEKTLERLRKTAPRERLEIGLALMNLVRQFLVNHPVEELRRRLAIAWKPWNLPPGPTEE
jgi:hypothetical protein